MTTMYANATEVSEKLFDLRQERGWSQLELHRRSGVARQSIINIENGAVEPRLSTLRKLARTFGVPVTEFMSEQEL